MLIEDKHTCENEKCNNEFVWYHLAPQKASGNLQAHILPKDKQPVSYVNKSIEKNGYLIPLNVSVHCPVCDRLNVFDLEERKNL